MKHLLDCGKCMEKFSPDKRRLMGCGYEPPHPSARPWQPPTGGKGYAHGKPTTCVGYTASLPVVVETVAAWVHWQKGAIESFAQGMPTEALLEQVVILEAEANAVQAWALTPKKDGGGLE